MRTLGGEDTALVPELSSSSLSSLSVNSYERRAVNSLQDTGGSQSDEDVAAEHEAELAAAEWALERESELARLEEENVFLRQLASEHLHKGSETSPSNSGMPAPEFPKLSSLPKVPARTFNGKLGGRDVGPFGMYKKFED